MSKLLRNPDKGMSRRLKGETFPREMTGERRQAQSREQTALIPVHHVHVPRQQLALPGASPRPVGQRPQRSDPASRPSSLEG